MQSVATQLVSKLVSKFAHETSKIFRETSFFLLLTKRVFFIFAHETSAHETSFYFCLRNECSWKEFLFFFPNDTSARETSFCYAHETSAHKTSAHEKSFKS